MRVLTFEVSDDEDRVIRSLAEKERVPLSEFLRRRAIQANRLSGTPERILCDFTGAMIFGPAPELVPLTTETVRQILADFP